MRKAIAGLLVGCVALCGAAGAVAATSVPFQPVEPAQFGQLNNRAVLGLAAAAQEECTPDSAGNGCPPGGEDGGFLDGAGLPVVAGIGIVAIGAAVAGGGGGGGSSSP
jgi:hypothetical protein